MAYPSNDAPPEYDIKREDIMLELNTKTSEAKILLKAGVREENVDEASILAKDIAAIALRAEKGWAVYKTPLDDELKRLKGLWQPLVTAARDLSRVIKDATTPIMVRRAQLEAAALEEKKREAEKLRQEAEAKVAALDIEDAPLDALLAAKTASDQAALQAEKIKEAEGNIGRAGIKGKTVTLRTFISAQIHDPEQVFKFFAKYPTSKAWGYISEALQRSANMAIKAGVKVPGATKLEEQKTV